MATILGPLGLVVVDNVEPSAALCRYLNDLMSHGIRVQIVMSGQPGYASAWTHILRSLEISFHRTTIMDAVREGLGQLVADARDEQWSFAWEFRWLAGVADLMEDQVDCPRFHGREG
jgi:phage FluMu gp28-like protein